MKVSTISPTDNIILSSMGFTHGNILGPAFSITNNNTSNSCLSRLGDFDYTELSDIHILEIFQISILICGLEKVQ